jgi:diguanylate cyclase (GGDEF)-like protein
VTKTYTERDGLANLSLTSVYVDPDGTVWAGTMLGGLNRLKDGKITRYSIEQGLSDSTVGAIVKDSEGYLWLSGTRGIMRVGLNELNDYAAGRIDKVSARTFGYAEGLRATECNMKAHPAAVRDAGGRLWFATMSGLAMIDPRHPGLEASAPRPIIEGLFANGREVKAGEKGLRIEPGQNVLSVRFATPTFVAPEETQIRYRLVGFQDAWIRGDPRQQVPFANLSPGHYLFELRAANSDGVSTGATATLSFDVLPHFYETSWFRIITLIGLLLGVWLCLRLRTRLLLRKNQELEQLILEKTSEVRLALESAEESREMLRELASRDTLTGLLNRRAIFEMLETQILQCADEGRPLTILMADIDHFKAINDTWGHQAGDDVIREVSRRLSQGVRRGDAVGRYGGEELLILLPDAPLELGMERAERLREAVCLTPVEIESCSIKVSCSFGLTFIQPGSSVAEIVGHADAALYQAKRDGRNCVRLRLPVEVAEARE